MSFADPIGDMITRIRNGQMRNLTEVIVPASKFRFKILEVLKKEGYISDYAEDEKEKNKKNILVNLKYNGGIPVIKEIKRVSKPGLRVYTKSDKIPRVLGGLGVAVVSTSKGLMSDREARRRRMGGEILCYVW